MISNSRTLALSPQASLLAPAGLSRHARSLHRRCGAFAHLDLRPCRCGQRCRSRSRQGLGRTATARTESRARRRPRCRGDRRAPCRKGGRSLRASTDPRRGTAHSRLPGDRRRPDTALAACRAMGHGKRFEAAATRFGKRIARMRDLGLADRSLPISRRPSDAISNITRASSSRSKRRAMPSRSPAAAAMTIFSKTWAPACRVPAVGCAIALRSASCASAGARRMTSLTLAIPSKGRLKEATEALFAKAGLDTRTPAVPTGSIAAASKGIAGVEVAFLSAAEIAARSARWQGRSRRHRRGPVERDDPARRRPHRDSGAPWLRPGRCRRRRSGSLARCRDHGRSRRGVGRILPPMAAACASPPNIRTSPGVSLPARASPAIASSKASAPPKARRPPAPPKPSSTSPRPAPRSPPMRLKILDDGVILRSQASLVARSRCCQGHQRIAELRGGSPRRRSRSSLLASRRSAGAKRPGACQL